VVSKPSSVGSKEWESAHNNYRSQFKYPPLEWNSDLAGQSVAYANQLEQRGEFEHGDFCNSKNCKMPQNENCPGEMACGQNLEAVTGAAVITPDTVVGHWVDECRNPGYHGTPTDGTGHYTQVMWQGAKEFGCGISKSGSRAACLYDEGNVIGEFSTNVPDRCPSSS